MIWIPKPDKVLHFLVGQWIFMLCIFVVSPIVALLYVLAFAIGKEVVDSIRGAPHQPDFWDVVATVAGGAVMMLWVSFLVILRQ